MVYERWRDVSRFNNVQSSLYSLTIEAMYDAYHELQAPDTAESAQRFSAILQQEALIGRAFMETDSSIRSRHTYRANPAPPWQPIIRHIMDIHIAEGLPRREYLYDIADIFMPKEATLLLVLDSIVRSERRRSLIPAREIPEAVASRQLAMYKPWPTSILRTA